MSGLMTIAGEMRALAARLTSAAKKLEHDRASGSVIERILTAALLFEGLNVRIEFHVAAGTALPGLGRQWRYTYPPDPDCVDPMWRDSWSVLEGEHLEVGSTEVRISVDRRHATEVEIETAQGPASRLGEVRGGLLRLLAERGKAVS